MPSTCPPRARWLPAVLGLVAATGCTDFAGPSPASYQVSTDKELYDAEALPPDTGRVLLLGPRYEVRVQLEIRNRGDTPLVLLECARSRGSELIHELVPEDRTGTWDLRGLLETCPLRTERVLAPGGLLEADLRLALLFEVVPTPDADARLRLLIGTRRGPLRSESFRIRIPGGQFPRLPLEGPPPRDSTEGTTGPLTPLPPP